MIPLKLKRTIVRAITHRALGATIAFIKGNIIKQYNCVYDVDSTEIKDQIKASMFWGLYEKAEASFVAKYLSGEYPVLELGGSIGVISCVIGKKLKNKKLIIIEANKSLLPIIEKNLVLNKICNYCIEWGGIGDGNQLYFIEGNKNHVGKVTTQYEANCELIDSIEIKNLLLRNDINSFSLVSDIEGAENTFLFESPSCLTNCMEIIIELHEILFKGQLISFEEQITQIEKLQFKILDRHGPVIYAKKMKQG